VDCLGWRAASTARASHITRHAGKLRRVCERGGWGRLSDDGPGQHNLDRSEGPWGRAVNPLARRCRCHVPYLDSERGHMALKTTRRSEANHGGLLIDPSYLGQAPTDSRPWSRTGENPPYGILGGTMETSASFEARLARGRELRKRRCTFNSGADDKGKERRLCSSLS